VSIAKARRDSHVVSDSDSQQVPTVQWRAQTIAWSFNRSFRAATVIWWATSNHAAGRTTANSSTKCDPRHVDVGRRFVLIFIDFLMNYKDI
jgi:hypothetical protein